MSPPSNKNKDTSHPRHRSHKGCWTCKRKRIQCDETRPSCKRCAERGLTCEGYEIRLRWGAGIASRGRFSGADKPIQESIPPPSKRRWDLRGKAEQRDAKDEQGQPVLLVGQVSSDGKRLYMLGCISGSDANASSSPSIVCFKPADGSPSDCQYPQSTIRTRRKRLHRYYQTLRGACVIK